MGVSTDGILGYGVYLDKDGDYELLQKIAKYLDPEFVGSGDDEDSDVGEVLYDKLESLGLRCTICCSYNYPQYLITGKDQVFSASRGYPENIPLDRVWEMPETLVNLINAVGISKECVGLWLASNWG